MAGAWHSLCFFALDKEQAKLRRNQTDAFFIMALKDFKVPWDNLFSAKKVEDYPKTVKNRNSLVNDLI